MLKEIQLAGSVRALRSESFAGTGGAENTPPELLQNHPPQPENGNECFYSSYFYTKPGAPQRPLAPVSQSLGSGRRQ